MSRSQRFTDGLDRRRFLKATAGAGAIGGLAGCLGQFTGGGDGGDGGLPSISAVRLANGATSVIEPVIAEQGYDEENGFDLEVIVRTDIGAYYGDFAAGTYDAIPIGTGTAASQFNQGVDMKILGGFNRPSTFFLAPEGEGDSLGSLADLEGASLGAPVGAGAYKLANMLSVFQTDQRIEDLVGNLVNAPGPVNPLLELTQGNVDYAMSWEPAITVQAANEELSFEQALDVRSQLQRDDAFGQDAWYLVWAIHTDVYEENTEAARGLVGASQEVGDLIENDLGTFLDIVETHTENPRAPLEEAISTGRLAYEFDPVNDIKSALQGQMETWVDLGIIDETPGDDIYGDVS